MPKSIATSIKANAVQSFWIGKSLISDGTRQLANLDVKVPATSSLMQSHNLSSSVSRTILGVCPCSSSP